MIEVDGRGYCLDPVGGLADCLGKKWTLPLIGVLGNRPVNRFGEIVAALEGVGAKALSDRLRELMRLGLVERQAYTEVPARVEYRLTPRGRTLRRALVPLLEWAALDAAATGRPEPPSGSGLG